MKISFLSILKKKKTFGEDNVTQELIGINENGSTRRLGI